MDHTNHWYGHAHILAEYCGLDPASPPPIRGVIQHGWNFAHGLGYGHVNDHSFTKLVWNDRNRRRGQVIGWRDFAVIGAPYLYLMELKKDEPAPEREGTIFYPFHGTNDYESVMGSHDKLIEQVKAVEDGPVTACLYYVEYDDPEIRKHYEDSGFRVITHGRRGNQWKGTDRLFLHRQLAELKRHRRIISNRLTTAVFYGVSVGLDLPAHWRTLVWALAVWNCGAEVRLPPWREEVDVQVSAAPDPAPAPLTISIALPALARQVPDLPAGAIDGAAELMAQPDVVMLAPEWDPQAPAFDSIRHADLGDPQALNCPAVDAQRYLVTPESAAETIRACAAIWFAGGSVVLVGDHDVDTDRITQQEDARPLAS